MTATDILHSRKTLEKLMSILPNEFLLNNNRSAESTLQNKNIKKIKMINNYYKPTPKKWEKGDAILFLSASISAFIPYITIDEGEKPWAMFA